MTKVWGGQFPASADGSCPTEGFSAAEPSRSRRPESLRPLHLVLYGSWTSIKSWVTKQSSCAEEKTIDERKKHKAHPAFALLLQGFDIIANGKAQSYPWEGTLSARNHLAERLNSAQHSAQIASSIGWARSPAESDAPFSCN